MLFRFKTNKLSDSLKLAQFLEKEGIEFEVNMDITVGVDGTAVSEARKDELQTLPPVTIEAKPNSLGITPISPDSDRAWKPSIHNCCTNPADKSCKCGCHYGMVIE